MKKFTVSQVALLHSSHEIRPELGSIRDYSFHVVVGGHRFAVLGMTEVDGSMKLHLDKISAAELELRPDRPASLYELTTQPFQGSREEAVKHRYLDWD